MVQNSYIFDVIFILVLTILLKKLKKYFKR